MKLKHHLTLLALTLPFWMGGCASLGAEKTVGAYVDAINYNHNRTYRFTLYDLSTEDEDPVSGGGVDLLASGGSVNCCIALPKQWRPGLKVRLVWRESNHTWVYEGGTYTVQRGLIGDHNQEFEIPRYTRPGNLYITFLPKGEVELVVSEVGLASKDWPGRIKQTPWNYCVETHGLKPCKLTLPKTFLVDSAWGYCTYWNRFGREDYRRRGKEIHDVCKSLMQSCLHDYEDEEFCNKVLWAKEPKGCHDRQAKPVWCDDQKALSDEDKKKYLLDWEKEQ
jgi:hypothetical protein